MYTLLLQSSDIHSSLKLYELPLQSYAIHVLYHINYCYKFLIFTNHNPFRLMVRAWFCVCSRAHWGLPV